MELEDIEREKFDGSLAKCQIKSVNKLRYMVLANYNIINIVWIMLYGCDESATIYCNVALLKGNKIRKHAIVSPNFKYSPNYSYIPG